MWYNSLEINKKGIIPMSFCPKCNKEYADNLPACPYCISEGNAQGESAQINTETNAAPNEPANTPQDNSGSEMGFFGEIQNTSAPQQDGNGKKPFPLAVVISVAAAVVVIAAVVLIAVFCFGGNKDNNTTSASTSANASSAVEDLTMPSGYEDVIKNIKDDQGHIITQATDPYGNTITREVDADGNVTTTYVGPDGQTSTVTTDRDGNIISYDIPTTPAASSESGNTSSKNNSSATSSKNNSSSSNTSSNTSSAQTPASGEVMINGKAFKVGDTVTLTATAEGINEAVAGFQFRIEFDENLLELDKDSIVMLGGGCLVNPDKPGKILINGISVSTGYNFSMPADFLVCKFKVKDSSTKACDIKIISEEIYTGTGSQELVDVTNDVETSMTVE